MSDADLARIKHLLELMFVGGLTFDSSGTLINATRWDYETSIFVSIELLATVGMSSHGRFHDRGRVFVRELAWVIRGGFRHVQHVRRNTAPTKRGPHKRTWAKNNRVITKYSVNVG